MAIPAEKTQINISLRVTLAFGVALACFFMIALRLWYLQILKGDYFRDRSENNRLRTIFMPPPRGLVFDRNGTLLVKTRPSFNVELVMEDCPDPRGTVKKLARMLKYDEGMLIERLKEQRKRRRFEPRLLLKDISRDTVAVVLAHRWNLPGVVINVVPTRDYEYKTLAAHVLGYIREITKNQLDDPRFSQYQMGDEIGQYGLEAEWERYLQGKRGKQEVIVNATGSKVGDFRFEPDIAGHNITTTLDFNVQKAADEALKGKSGAIVALDPKTGDILAMSSAPAFDPNVFTGDMSPALWKELTTGKAKILNNRAVQGAYPPGSVWKVFMSVAGLSEGVIRENDIINCPGVYFFGGRLFRCWRHQGHGPVSFMRGLTASCDVYFYTVGQRLGIDRIHEYAAKFGLGSPTGLKLVHENPGVVPSTLWKRTFFKDPAQQKWYPGETISVAIGQGAVTTTPLQIARGVAGIVNGGRLVTPQLVKKIESPDGLFLDTDFKPQSTKIDVDPRILKKVLDAMVSVVNDPNGTGKQAQLPKELGITVGGKTGTAQAASLDVRTAGDHAWFVGFAPAEDPKIVVVALVEHGGHGGSASAPLVKQVMEAFFGYVPPPPDATLTPQPQAGNKVQVNRSGPGGD